MTRLLATTAVGLFLGLTPAFAQADPPAEQGASPPAVQQPAMPSEIKPSEPAAPGASSEAQQPSDPASPSPGASTEAAPPVAPAQPGGEASPPTKSSEAPESIIPDSAGKADKSAEAPDASSAGPQFLAKQDSKDWLASDLIGKSVVNANNETIGEISDLITDEQGKIVAALIGAGGFLGIGAKDVAVRFEDLKLARDEGGEVSVMANLSNDTLASAPDYETLSEQAVTMGATDNSTGAPSTKP
jgi:sporulation protein YlmC with PRC-barrel domain